MQDRISRVFHALSILFLQHDKAARFGQDKTATSAYPCVALGGYSRDVSLFLASLRLVGRSRAMGGGRLPVTGNYLFDFQSLSFDVRLLRLQRGHQFFLP